MTDLWRRLRQRKLVQWALAYVAFAFALVQGIDVIAQQFGWPEALQRGITLALVLGFFVTLLLAWYHGERGAQKVTGTELLLLALLLAIGGGLLWKFAPGGSGAPSVASAGNAGHQSVSADRHSIAVLPFVNMSADKDNTYFSDGVSEEILNVLAGIPNLKVAARTSSFAFQGSKQEIPLIAHELGVRMILEGSVRKQADQVRITAQLIDARSGFQVWSHTYDRQLKNIFALQDDIAQAVGRQLKLRVDGGTSRQAHRGTTNTQAYDHYLRGIALWQTRKTANLWQAIDQFNEAIAADPDFAQAWGGLALAYVVLPDYSTRITYAEAWNKAQDAAERALALDPQLPESYAVLGDITNHFHPATGIALLRRATILRPSFATAYQWMGNAQSASGHTRAGLDSLQKAASLDPHSVVILDNMAGNLLFQGHTNAARAVCDRGLKIDPEFADLYLFKALAYLMDGKPRAARPFYLRAARMVASPNIPELNRAFDALEGHGDRKAVIDQLASMHQRDPAATRGTGMFGTLYTPSLLMMLGAPQQAMDYIDYEIKHPGSGNTVPNFALLLPIYGKTRCTPRFRAMVKSLGMTDPHAAAVCGSDATHASSSPE